MKFCIYCNIELDEEEEANGACEDCREVEGDGDEDDDFTFGLEESEDEEC